MSINKSTYVHWDQPELALIINETLISVYWLQFTPVVHSVNVVLALFAVIVTILSVSGNALVLYVYLRSPSLRLVNCFTINLALGDLLSPLFTHFLFAVTSLNDIWILGSSACQFYGFTQGFFGLMAIVSMAVISTERYLAINWPFVVRSWTYRQKLLTVGGVWLYSFALASPPLFHWGKYVPVAYLTTCCFDYISRDSHTRSFIMYLFIFGFIVPIGVILFCYAQIFRLVRLQDVKMLSVRYCGSCNHGSADIQTVASRLVERRPTVDLSGRQSFSNHLRTARIMSVVIGTFLLTWTPYACVALVGQFGPEGSLTPTVAMSAAVIAKTSSIYNPVIYAFKDKKFRLAAVKLISTKLAHINCLRLRK